MVALVWDRIGEREYETGVSNGALYVVNDEGITEKGVAWNGLVAVRETPDGAEETPMYADNIKYLSLTSAENFSGTIEAFTYPDEFAECEGRTEISPGIYVGQQGRRSFGMAYVTKVGNDTMGTRYGEKLNVVYQAKVAPTERAFETINNDPTAIKFSWAFTTTPIPVEAEGIDPSAHIVIDSTDTPPEVYKAIKDAFFGTADKEPTLLTIDEIIALGAATV